MTVYVTCEVIWDDRVNVLAELTKARGDLHIALRYWNGELKDTEKIYTSWNQMAPTASIWIMKVSFEAGSISWRTFLNEYIRLICCPTGRKVDSHRFLRLTKFDLHRPLDNVKMIRSSTKSKYKNYWIRRQIESKPAYLGKKKVIFRPDNWLTPYRSERTIWSNSVSLGCFDLIFRVTVLS